MSEDPLGDLPERFAEAEQALAEAKTHLDGLASAEERTATASAALTEASEAVRGFAGEAGRAVAGLAEVQGDARKVLEQGVALLDGNDLRELKAGVEGLEAKVEERLKQLESRIGDVEKVEAQRDLLQRQLDYLKTNVTHRQMRNALKELPS